jgi:hypothetical protein
MPPWLQILLSAAGGASIPTLTLAVYLGRKLQILDNLHEEKLPKRVAILETLAGVEGK